MRSRKKTWGKAGGAEVAAGGGGVTGGGGGVVRRRAERGEGAGGQHRWGYAEARGACEEAVVRIALVGRRGDL